MKNSLEMILQKGDIIQVKGKDWISNAIKILTNSEYAHTAMYMGDETLIESNFEKGVCKVPLTKYNEFDVYRHVAITPIKQKEVCDWAETKIGYKYDFLGIFGIFLSMLKNRKSNPFDDKDSYWCSELVSDAYINNGIFMCVDSQTWTVTPNDLAVCDGFKKIFSYSKNLTP